MRVLVVVVVVTAAPIFVDTINGILHRTHRAPLLPGPPFRPPAERFSTAFSNNNEKTTNVQPNLVAAKWLEEFVFGKIIINNLGTLKRLGFLHVRVIYAVCSTCNGGTVRQATFISANDRKKGSKFVKTNYTQKNRFFFLHTNTVYTACSRRGVFDFNC